MTLAQQRAFNAGSQAYRQRGDNAGTLNTFRSREMRRYFRQGVERERQFDHKPDEGEDYDANLATLKAFAKTL